MTESPVPDENSGEFLDLKWVDTPDFGESPDDRRTNRIYDLDPAPLDRLLSRMILNRGGTEVIELMRAIAEDDRDGPIHLVHLMAACEAAARDTGGGLPGSQRLLFNPPSNAGEFIAGSVGGDVFGALVSELRATGLKGATRAARTLSPPERQGVLDTLLHYFLGPLTQLRIDITDSDILRPDDDRV